MPAPDFASSWMNMLFGIIGSAGGIKKV